MIYHDNDERREVSGIDGCYLSVQAGLAERFHGPDLEVAKQSHGWARKLLTGSSEEVE